MLEMYGAQEEEEENKGDEYLKRIRASSLYDSGKKEVETLLREDPLKIIQSAEGPNRFKLS